MRLPRYPRVLAAGAAGVAASVVAFHGLDVVSGDVTRSWPAWLLVLALVLAPTALRRAPAAAVQVAAALLLAIVDPAALLPAMLVAASIHLLRLRAHAPAAAWSLTLAPTQALVAFALAPGAATAALVPATTALAALAAARLHGRAVRERVGRRGHGPGAVSGGHRAPGASRLAPALGASSAVLGLALALAWLAPDPVLSRGTADRAEAPPSSAAGGAPPDTPEEPAGRAADVTAFSTQLDLGGIWPGDAITILARVRPLRDGVPTGEVGPIHLRALVMDGIEAGGPFLSDASLPGLVRDVDDGVRDGWVETGGRGPPSGLELEVDQARLSVGTAHEGSLLLGRHPVGAWEAPSVRHDPDRFTHTPGPVPAPLVYRVRLDLPASFTRAAATTATHRDGRWIGLPRGHPVVARLASTARAATAGAATDLERVRRILGTFAEGFDYSLQAREVRGLDALGAFLDARAGHCAHYATAAAVMLRSQGIPARVVNGFVARDWNAVAEAYDVVPRDAHAWLEVHFEGVGWMPFDPTPADRRRQALAALGAPAESGPEDGGDGGLDPRAVLLRLAGLLVLMAFAAVGVRAALGALDRRPGAGPHRGAPATPALRRAAALERALARRGFRRPPSWTLRELARHAVDRGGPPYEPLLRAVDLIYADRFGDHPPSAADAAELDALLAAIPRLPRAGESEAA